MEKNLSLFKNISDVQVRNYEVDWQGIVHNANYLHYYEVGRVNYLNSIGAKIDINSINSNVKILLVRNEINYFKSAKLLEDLIIYTRIPKIGNTSFVIEGAIYLKSTNELISDNFAFHVWVDVETNKPTRVPEYFRDLVRKYEIELNEK